jgi:hypothetical protein
MQEEERPPISGHVSIYLQPLLERRRIRGDVNAPSSIERKLCDAAWED